MRTNGASSGNSKVSGSVSLWRLWDVRDPRHPSQLGTLFGHTDVVYSVVFSPNGHALATGSFDDMARLWETNVENIAARICDITPTITKSEWDQYLPGLPYRPPCPRATRSAGRRWRGR